MMKQPKHGTTHVLSYIWNYWIKPPRLKMPKTLKDLQKESGIIGGNQFKEFPGLEQVFFWMPEALKGPKIGEYVYMKYEPDKSGNVNRVISHIHYPISVSQDGSMVVKKYFASNDVGREINYRHYDIDAKELQDLLTAARQLKNNLKKSWNLN